MPLRAGLQLPEALPVRSGMPVLRQQVSSSKDACAEPGSTQASASFATLLAHRREFLRFLKRRVGSPAQAEDLLQSAYVRAMEQASGLRAEESSVAWFYRILRNAVIDAYRHRVVEDRAVAAWAGEAATETPANDLTQELACECIAKVIPSLRPGYAEILRAVDLEEGTLVGFAEARGISAANAGMRLHRARKALKQALLAMCGICGMEGCRDCNCHA